MSQTTKQKPISELVPGESFRLNPFSSYTAAKVTLSGKKGHNTTVEAKTRFNGGFRPSHVVLEYASTQLITVIGS